MHFKVGDKVVFKDENIEGFVTKIIDSTKVEVTDNDGFGIPALVHQIIKIDNQPINDKPKVKDVQSILATKSTNFHQAIYLIALPNLSNWDIYILNNLNYKSWIQVYQFKKGDWVLKNSVEVGSNSFVHSFVLKSNELSDFKEIGLVVLPQRLAQKELPIAENYILKVLPQKFTDKNEMQKVSFLNTDGFVFVFQKNIKSTFSTEDIWVLEDKIKSKPQVLKSFSNDIEDDLEDVKDLHIEKLHSNSEELNPFEILDYQIKAADRFITQAKRLNRKKIVLIHGKGKGVLKNKIRDLVLQHKLTFEYSDFNSGETIIKL